MNVSDVTLRLLDPWLMAGGIAYLTLSLSVFILGSRFGAHSLRLAALGFFVVAAGKLMLGGLDMLLWYGVLSSDYEYPKSLAWLTVSAEPALLVSALSVAYFTHRVHRRQT